MHLLLILLFPAFPAWCFIADILSRILINRLATLIIHLHPVIIILVVSALLLAPVILLLLVPLYLVSRHMIRASLFSVFGTGYLATIVIFNGNRALDPGYSRFNPAETTKKTTEETRGGQNFGSCGCCVWHVRVLGRGL